MTARAKHIDSRVLLRIEYVQTVELVRALSLSLVALVRIPFVCRSMIGVACIQLMISNNCETGIRLAYPLPFTFT